MPSQKFSDCYTQSQKGQHGVEKHRLLYSDLPLLWPRPVRINAALDLGDALIMADDHRGNGDCATDEDRADGNQQAAQTEYGIDQSIHSPRSLGG